MKQFEVEISRRFVQHETAMLTVTAASAKEARRIAKEQSANDGLEWDVTESVYDCYSVEDVNELAD